jgi:hypothetical protein
MTENSQPQVASDVRALYEVLFSFTTGFVIMVSTFKFGPSPAVDWLFRMNGYINYFLHVRPTGLATSYFVFFIGGTGLALLIWILLLWSRESTLNGVISCYVGGIVSLVAEPILSCIGQRAWHYGWTRFEAAQNFEAALTVISVVLYVRDKWPIPTWTGALALAFHYIFWMREMGVYPFLFGIGESVTWIAACITSIVWVLYVRSSHVTRRKIPTD